MRIYLKKSIWICLSDIKLVQNQGERLVCKLNKSIYGLNQASPQWFAKFLTFLLSLSFCQSKACYSLFIKSNEDSFIAFLVYVDDIIITNSSISAIQNLKLALNDCFKRKDLGSLKYFLRLELARFSSSIFLSQ